MSTILVRKAGVTRYSRKELVLKLVRVEDDLVLGSAELDLAEYHACRERTRFQAKIVAALGVDAEHFNKPRFDV